jgi:hypothetical protein
MATSFEKGGKNYLTTGQGAGGVPGSINFEDHGGGQKDNAFRAGFQPGRGEVNPYFPDGNASAGKLTTGGSAFDASFSKPDARQRHNPGFSTPPGTEPTGTPTAGGFRQSPVTPGTNMPNQAGGFNQVGNQPTPEPTGPYPKARSWGDGNATEADTSKFWNAAQEQNPSAFSSDSNSGNQSPYSRFTADQAMYDGFSDKAYAQATRTLDPTFDRARKDFDQRVINQGIATGSEAYDEEFDRFMRDKNDAYSNAAFGAMGYGADRMDRDRDYSENNYRFDTGLAEDNRRYDQQFGLTELTTMEGLGKTYRDESYRDAVFNSQQDQQQFNNLFSAIGMAPGGNYTAPNTSSAFNNAQDASMYNANADSAMYTGIGNTVNDLAAVDWGAVDWGKFNPWSTPAAQTSAATPQSFMPQLDTSGFNLGP